MNKHGWWWLGSASSLLLPGVSSAHHSFAMFDNQKVLEVHGTVKDFQWTNPHAWLDVVVVNKSGASIVWGVEMTGPGMLYREGWRADSVKPGDKVVVQIHPLKDGRSGGSLVAAVLPNGATLTERGPNGRPSPSGQ